MQHFLRRTWMLALVALAVAPAATAAPAGPDALVTAEHGFARDAATRSVRDAFLTWLAPTAVVFHPGPMNARKIYLAAKPNRARLTWEPVVAVMSGDGSLGWTTGPWEWRSDSTHVQPEATGDFVTLWRRQSDGAFKAALDIGIEHPPAPGARPALQSRALAPAPTRTGALGQRHNLWKADADYALTASAQGLAAALAGAAASDVRWLHQGMLPVIGHDAARDSAAAHVRQGRMMSLAQFVADSGDLGYTYGTLVEGSGATSDSSYFLHVWQRAPGRPWELSLELLLPVPPAKK